MIPESSELRRTQRRYLERIALNRRPNTVINARTTTKGFIRYLEDSHPAVTSFSQLERVHVEAWLHHLATLPWCKSTRRNAIIKVRGFLADICAWGWAEPREEVLLRHGDLPPEDKHLPRPLSDDTDRALQAALEAEGGLIPTALLLLRVTGLRCQEILDLEVHSLRKLPRNEWALHVPLGKLHDERVIPLDSRGAELFHKLLELRGSPPPIRHPERGKATGFLLMRPSGQRITREALRYHLNRAEKVADLREHPTPHRLRHTYATEMLRADMKLTVLMQLLGHRHLGMTLRYAKLFDVDVHRAYFDATAAIGERYSIPQTPAQRPRGDSRASLLAGIDALAAAMQSFRSDRAPRDRRKPLQRLVERLRRIQRDFRSLSD